MTHRLDPLLRPRSVAVIGATEREYSVGRRTLHNLLAGGFQGPIYAINPSRDTVLGQQAWPSLDELPGPAEHAVFCISDRRLLDALEQALDHGVRAVTLMSQLIDQDNPRLAAQVEDMLHEAGALACGPNGMGFYNARDGVWMCGFDTRENHPRHGNVTLISHSGAGMSGIVDCEERLDFNLAVSGGSELNVGMADYMDFALENHEPAVIGLFMETARDPEALIAALKKARQQEVPVVALKVGRTALSARLAESHSGAIAGEDHAYQAIFDRYGVQRVKDMDELVAALMLFAQPHPVADGGLVAIHDSGGERQLLIDLADELGTPLARITDRTEQALAARLDPGLPPVNPLDAWGTGGEDSDAIMCDCLGLLMNDPNAALGAVVQDRAPHSRLYPEYVDYCRSGFEASGKPAVLVANHQGSGSDPLVLAATREGFPVIDGIRPFLTGVNCLLEHRDYLKRPAPPPLQMKPEDRHMALLFLEGGGVLDEGASLSLLSRLGLPGNESIRAASKAEVLDAARTLGFPVVLKTAEEGQSHKTESAGVHLNLHDEDALQAAWDDLSERLGEQVLVSRMAPGGVEMALGMVRDPQFGPLVMLGFGGISLEAMKDVAYAAPPFDTDSARRLLQGLKQWPLLTVERGQAAPAVDTFLTLAADFSQIVAGLGNCLQEVDLNPVIVHPNGSLLVDALIIPDSRAVNAALESNPKRPTRIAS